VAAVWPSPRNCLWSLAKLERRRETCSPHPSFFHPRPHAAGDRRATGVARICVEALLTAGARTVPIGRRGRPDDIAGAILFLTAHGGVGVTAEVSMFGGDE
jgi:NAD(P)-dependent dehydrogenase (short-subunit alcohol dehydrogenase family)